MLTNGLTDGNLPIHLNEFGRLNLTPGPDINLFSSGQGIFPPILGDSNFDVPFSVVPEIPVRYGDVTLGDGVAGKVYAARVDTSYHSFQGVRADTGTTGFSQKLAIKFVENRNAQQQRHSNAEQSFLQQMGAYLLHPHITRTYGAFNAVFFTHSKEKISGTYFISELGSQNLSEYIVQVAVPAPSSELQKWEKGVCNQICGLADALVQIHSPTQGKSAVHHDIKPENIIVFSDKDGKTTFEFTDWSCASVHPYPANQGVSTQTPDRGQFPYLPPEIVPVKSGMTVRTSRPHDIWSLACIFVQLLVWITEEKAAASTFVTLVHESDPTSNWFSYTNGQRALTPLVDDKLANISAKDRGKWKNLVNIILLMFDIDPDSRITAANLVKTLKVRALEF
jgi:serine/threonine protein kinase